MTQEQQDTIDRLKLDNSAATGEDGTITFTTDYGGIDVAPDGSTFTYES